MKGKSRRVGIRAVLVSGMVLSLVVALFVNLDALSSLAQVREVTLEQGKAADAARLAGLAEAYLTGGRSRVREAETARLTGLAHHHLAGSDADCQLVAMTRAQRTDADRLTRQAEHTTGLSISRMPVFDRGRMATSTRLSGIAARLGLEVDVDAPALACLGGP